MESAAITRQRQPVFHLAIAVLILVVFAVDFVLGGGEHGWAELFSFAGGLLGGTLFTQAWYERRAMGTAPVT